MQARTKWNIFLNVVCFKPRAPDHTPTRSVAFGSGNKRNCFNSVRPLTYLVISVHPHLVSELDFLFNLTPLYTKGQPF
jgi:hypothetical protein